MSILFLYILRKFFLLHIQFHYRLYILAHRTKVQESRLLRLRQSLYDLKIEKNRMTIVLRKWQDQLALREQAKEKK